MSLSLFESENIKRVEETPIVQHSDPGAFDGFIRGTGQIAMKGFAESGRALSMAGAAVPILYDAVNGGTEASDRYFKGHDEIFNSAVDYWTPKPEEVGIAGQVAGTLLSTLPLIIASPATAVAKTQLSVSEDLVRAGVDSTKAQAVGAVQAASLGFGVWLPILGKNLVQRVVVGGAMANVVQGAATRGISGEILEGTKAEGQFRAFDPEQLTLDALLGLAFGTLAHISPKQRVQGAEAWKNIESWASRLKSSDVEAMAVLRQAQHLNVDSIGGKVQDVSDIDAHVTRARKAIDQLSRDERVNVDDLPAARIVPDPMRQAESEARLRDMIADGERILIEEGRPIRAYHGTTESFKKFSAERLGETTGAASAEKGFFFTKSPEVAEAYATIEKEYKPKTQIVLQEKIDAIKQLDNEIYETKKFGGDIASLEKDKFKLEKEFDSLVEGAKTEGANIRPVDLEMKNPFVVDMAGKHKRIETYSALIDKAKNKGHDGLIIKNTFDAPGKAGDIMTDVYVVFDTKQIKTGFGPEKSITKPSTQQPKMKKAAEALTKEDKPADPLTDAARQFAKNNPDISIRIGEDAEGNPMMKNVQQLLDEADANVKKATDDSNLFKVAASCLLGIA